jgi:uncharacterized alkaline shock family protein YloU
MQCNVQHDGQIRAGGATDGVGRIAEPVTHCPQTTGSNSKDRQPAAVNELTVRHVRLTGGQDSAVEGDEVMAEIPEAQAHEVEVRPRSGELATERRVTQSGPSPFVSPEGKTTIADSVVAKIAGIAAREITGVQDLGGQGASGVIAGLSQRVGVGDVRSQGVSVEVGEREAAIDLVMTVNYGVNIPQVAEVVRRNVISLVQAMTGYSVKEVNISVTDLFFAEDTPQPVERRVE